MGSEKHTETGLLASGVAVPAMAWAFVMWCAADCAAAAAMSHVLVGSFTPIQDGHMLIFHK